MLKLQRDQGVIVPVDYTNTEVNYNNTRSQLTLAENDVSLAINRLKYQMGLSQEASLALADSVVSRELPVIEDIPFEAARLVSFQQAATGIKLQQLQLRRIRAGYLPTVSLNFAYGTLNFAQSFGDVFNSKPRGFGLLALQVNVPIFDGFRRDAQGQQQKLTLLTQDEQQRLNTSAYRLQFSNALSQLQRNTNRA